MTAAGKPVRVAVIGASGIGKHHAKWWHAEGADVCGFAGSSEASVSRTREALRQLFDFQGKGYASARAMIDAEAPDIVDVCSPPRLHLVHARLALEAGCHVLCEKPLFYDETLSPDAMIEAACELTASAEAKNLSFGVCVQYAVAAEWFARIWRDERQDEPVTQYYGHLESPARGRAPDPGRVWVDLSPHPLSVLLKLFPGAAIDWASLDVRFSGYEASAAFEAQQAGGPAIACELVTRNAEKPPLNVRRFRLNGYAFDVEGENDEHGVYRARIETAGGVHREPDMMRALIRGMLEGRPAATARDALKNLEYMLQILEIARAD